MVPDHLSSLQPPHNTRSNSSPNNTIHPPLPSNNNSATNSKSSNPSFYSSPQRVENRFTVNTKNNPSQDSLAFEKRPKLSFSLPSQSILLI